MMMDVKLALVALTTTLSMVSSESSSLETFLGTNLGAKEWGFGLQQDIEKAISTKNTTTDLVHSRRARQLIDFPDSAVMEFYFKLVVPYWTYGKASTKGDYRFEVTFELPNELRRRKRRSLASERSDVYVMLSDFLSKAGLDGDTCILRAVCEIAEAPLDEYGLFGEFINLLFAPGFRAEKDLQDHIQAEDYGRSFGNCWSAFPDCPVSMREMLYEFFLSNSDAPLENEL